MVVLFPIFLILYEFAANLSNDMYAAALPAIAGEFSSTDRVVTLTLTAWLLGSSSIELIIGPLSDQRGRRPVLFGGGIIFLLATVGCALAPSLGLLIVARFFQGLGVCSLMVSGYAAIHEWYSDRKAVVLLAWMGSAAVMAPMLGPSLGGALLLLGEWRFIFWVIFVLAIVALGGLWLTMPESNLAPDPDALQPKRFLRVYLRIAKNPQFVLSALTVGLAYAGMFVWVAESSFVVIELLGDSPLYYSISQIPVFGAYFLGARGVKYILPRWIVRYDILWGLGIACLSGIAMVIASVAYPMAALSMLIPMACYAFGMGMASAPMNRRTLVSTKEARGSAIAVFYFVLMMAGAIGTFLIAIFYQYTLLSASLIIAVLIVLSFIIELVRKCLP